MSDALIEAVVSAHRERDGHGHIRPAPAWHDLTPDERDTAFTATEHMRAVEAALAGQSATVRAVLARIRG